LKKESKNERTREKEKGRKVEEKKGSIYGMTEGTKREGRCDKECTFTHT
jgi:hypothetical protein